MSQSEQLKKAVGYEAAALIEDGMVVGLGTGSTVRYLLEAIAERRRGGALGSVVGVPTSEDTTRKAISLGIPLGSLTDYPELDLALDGADEIDPSLDLIKGLGGALLREKIVVAAADDFVVLADETKLVSQLGTRAPLPVGRSIRRHRQVFPGAAHVLCPERRGRRKALLRQFRVGLHPLATRCQREGEPATTPAARAPRRRPVHVAGNRSGTVDTASLVVGSLRWVVASRSGIISTEALMAKHCV